MFYSVKGDLFEGDYEAIVNPVNTRGVMGKGLALVFKEKFPYNFNQYTQHCRAGKMRIGKVLGVYEKGTYVINLPTKDHWKDKSEIYYITEGLISLRNYLIKNNIQSIAIPAIGCGLGGLNWETVKEIIYKELSMLEFDVDMYLFEPN